MKKTMICAFAVSLSLAVAVPTMAHADYVSEWVTDKDGRIFYYDETGKFVTGEQEIDGEIYLFSKNGVQKTGWRTVRGERKYYDTETGKAIYGWIDYCGKQYYIEEKKEKQTDCILENADGKLVLLDDKGSVKTGTGLTQFGDGFYFVKDDGTLSTSVAEVDGVEYLFNEQTGKMQFGWLDINDKKRYFYEDATYAKGITKINGETYVFSEDGLILSGLQTVDGKIYYADEQGKAVKGMTAVGDDFYCFGEDGTAVSGITEIDGEKYLFGNDCRMCKGMTDFDGKKYYLDTESGKMLLGKLLIDGKKYYFADDGSMQFGWATIGEDRYYLTEDGTAASGLIEIDGKNYYFNADSGVMMTGRLLINGRKYYFADDGSMQFGLQEVDGDKYFFDTDGKMVTGWQEIDSNKYCFNATSGKMEKNKVIDNTTALSKDGTVVDMSAVQKRAQSIINTTGTNAKNIFDYVRGKNVYSYIEATRSLADIEAKGWDYFADYSLNNRFIVCYYFAAVTDLLFKQAGYDTRIVYGTGTHTTDHYWNQVYINGKWLNYDTCNGYCGVSDEYLKSLTYTWTQFVYAKYY